MIANTQLRIGPDVVDATTITKELLGGTLQEALDVEKNVAIGYHAIEFLLWGQDLNGTGPGAGKRPWTDLAPGDACTNGNCDRRRAYLAAATDLLVDDLGEMVADWGPDGAARTAVAERDDAAGLTAILTGIGSLSYGELGGERMKLGLMLHDPEEEHDCFSDNTHNSHYYDQVGMMAIWNGRYTRLDGKVVEGPSVADDRRRQGARGQGRGRRADGRDAGPDAGDQGHGRQRQDGLRPDARRRQCGGQRPDPGRGRRAGRADPRRRGGGRGARTSRSRSRAPTASTTRRRWASSGARCSSAAGGLLTAAAGSAVAMALPGRARSGAGTLTRSR